MATIIGGRTVEVPDDLDPSKPSQQHPLRSAGGAPPPVNPAPPVQPGDLRAGATNPLPASDTTAYNNSPEGRASQRQYHSARAQQAGVGAGYSGAPPVGNNATAGSAAEAEAAARYAQQTGRATPGAASAPAAPQPAPPVKGALRRAAGWAGALGGVGFGAYEALKGVKDGNYGDAALGAADAAAAAALMSPLPHARVAGGLWAGGRAAVAGINGMLGDEGKDLVGRAVNRIGTDTGLWGVDDSNHLKMKAEQNLQDRSIAKPDLRNPPTTVPVQTAQPPNLRDSAANPYAEENARKLAEFGAQNPNLGAQNPNPGAQSPTINNVLRNGNSYEGGNIAGDITINGRAPGGGGGISAQNMAAADALAGRDSLRSMGAAQVPMAQAPTVQHSGNSWQARNDLRNLEVSASSITNNGGRFDRHKGMSPAAQAYQAALKNDLALRGAQPGLDLETTKSNNSLRGNLFEAQTRADTSRYAADQGLRGDIFKAQGAERAAARQAQRDAATAASAERKYTTERRDKSLERLDKVFETEATRDGKVDAQHLAAMRNGAQAFLGTAIESARKRGDLGTVQQLESQGLSALAEDPQLMRRYTAALSADRAARGGWMPGENYVGTDNPGGRTVMGVDKGTFVDTVRLSDGTTMNANRLRYRNGGPLSGINPWAEPTTEFDSMDPKGYLRRPQQ